MLVSVKISYQFFNALKYEFKDALNKKCYSKLDGFTDQNLLPPTPL